MPAFDDEEPILVNTRGVLEPLSVDELEARIETLKEAIRACEGEIERKKAQKSAADALFGGGS